MNRQIRNPDEIFSRGCCKYCKRLIISTKNADYETSGDLHHCPKYVGSQIQIDQKEFFILKGGDPVRVGRSRT